MAVHRDQINFMCQSLNFVWCHIITRHTLVWKGIILVAVFFLCPITHISATVAPIGVKFSMMVRIGPGQIFCLFGIPRDFQIRNFGPKFWPSDREYLENDKSQRYMSISLTSARWGLSENVSLRAVAPSSRECTPVWRVCVLLAHLFILLLLLLLLLQMLCITVLPSHGCGGTLQNLDIKLLHSSMQTSADYRSRRRHVSHMSDEKGETWSPSGMSKVRSRPESLVADCSMQTDRLLR